MGAWIEIAALKVQIAEKESRTPRWVRGLKLRMAKNALSGMRGRTPRWVRGLKLKDIAEDPEEELSHPTMGAWIEIKNIKSRFRVALKSHPTMGAWIEIINRWYTVGCT